ncbi:MAG: CatA-like O-acetyltransferase [Pilosibacter sp.]
MIFTPVDLDSWERRSHYEYYTKLLKCGYSVTVSLDITKLHRQVKEKGLRFYPVFVYCVSRQIAATKEFRNGAGQRRESGIL